MALNNTRLWLFSSAVVVPVIICDSSLNLTTYLVNWLTWLKKNGSRSFKFKLKSLARHMFYQMGIKNDVTPNKWRHIQAILPIGKSIIKERLFLFQQSYLYIRLNLCIEMLTVHVCMCVCVCVCVEEREAKMRVEFFMGFFFLILRSFPYDPAITRKEIKTEIFFRIQKKGKNWLNIRFSLSI